jgi:hypothetical protein
LLVLGGTKTNKLYMVEFIWLDKFKCEFII